MLVNLYVFVWNKDTSVGAIKAKAAAATLPPAMVPGAPLAAPVAAPPAAPAIAGVPGCPVTGTTAKVQKGDTLGGALKKRAGLTVDERDGVIRALSPVFDFKMLRAGQVVTIERTPDGKLLRVILAAKDGTVFAERASGGGFVGGKGDPCVPLAAGDDHRHT
ncbi:MAG TPA: LysM domain-containing protein [Kofleriaceae bacterium]